MSTTIKLGRVVGKDATINGVSTLTLTAENGIIAEQTGDTLKLSSPELSTHVNDSDVHVTLEDKARWDAATGGPDTESIGNLINTHNTSESAHSDIRELVNTKASEAKTYSDGILDTAKNYIDGQIDTIPDWAMNANKPGYTAAEVGAEAAGSINDHNNSNEAHANIRTMISEKFSESKQYTDSQISQLRDHMTAKLATVEVME